MRHRDMKYFVFFCMDYAIAQAVTKYSAFRDFIYLWCCTFTCNSQQISIRSLLHMHLQYAVN